MSRGTLLFNPAAASSEELENLLIARESLLRSLEKEMNSQRDSDTRQHVLLVGPRGSGKTHVTEVLSRRLVGRKRRKWRVVRLPEESYSYSGLDDLLTAIVVRDQQMDRAWDEEPLGVDEAVEVLSRRERETKTPLLVVLENLPRVFSRVLKGHLEIERLRSILMNDPPFTLLATATRYFDQIIREDQPFYDFFRVFKLRDLTGKQVEDLVVRKATWDGIPAVLRELDLLRRRVRAIHHLSGGNPRLALALYEVVAHGVSEDIHRQFLGLLDRITPYYQARIDDLSVQQASILMKLATAPRALTASELGRACGVSTSHASAVIDVLLSERLVKRRPGGPRGRATYSLVDRLFRIWLELRENRGARRRMRFLVEFFRAAYTRHERKEACRRGDLDARLEHAKAALKLENDNLEAQQRLACVAAHSRDAEQFFAAAQNCYARSSPEERKHLLSDIATALVGHDPNQYRSAFTELAVIAREKTDKLDVGPLYFGLWTELAPSVRPEWVVSVVTLFETAGSGIEPWQSLRVSYHPNEVDREREFSAMHEEIRDGIELLLTKLGIASSAE